MDFSYFGTVKSIAFKDDSGVYLDGEKLAVSNTSVGGYVRYADGYIDFESRDSCSGTYNVDTDLVFVGHAPGCTEDDVYCNVLSTAECNDYISSLSFDKKSIAESEGIPLEELSKFSNVLLVRMEYSTKETKIYDPLCDYGIC